MDRPFSLKITLPWRMGDLDPRLVHAFWAYPTQRPPNDISIGSAVFAQLTPQNPCTLQWVAPFLLKIAHTLGGLDSYLIGCMVSWAHPSPQPKRHLHRLIGFCRAHDRDRQTDKQTNRPRYSRTLSVTIGRI